MNSATKFWKKQNVCNGDETGGQRPKADKAGEPDRWRYLLQVRPVTGPGNSLRRDLGPVIGVTPERTRDQGLEALTVNILMLVIAVPSCHTTQWVVIKLVISNHPPGTVWHETTLTSH